MTENNTNTQMTATKRRLILKEFLHQDPRDTVRQETMIKSASRHQTSPYVVRDLLISNGFQCEALAPPPRRNVVPIKPEEPANLSPVPELVVRSILSGSIYRVLGDTDGHNDPFVIARLSAWNRERAALKKILSGG